MAVTTYPAALGTVNQIDAGVLNVGYVDSGPTDGPAVVLLHGWPYDIHSYADVAPLLTAAGYRVIVPLPPRLRNDALPLRRHGPQRRAGGARARRARTDGRARYREGRRRRVRLGRAKRGHRRRALAGAVQRPGLGERLPDRQPGSRASCRCRPRPSSSGGTSTTSPRSAVAPATTTTGASSRS